MKRVLVLLVALAAPAQAKADPACTCESTRVLPANNAVDVPTNAHFWRLPSRKPGPPIKPYTLATHATFVLQGLSFTTGSGPDYEPPIPPAVTAASVLLVTSTPAAPVATLRVTAATSADTAVIHLRFRDSRGHIENYYTSPDQLSVCEPDIALAPGHIRLDVTAIDLAGNESAADTTELETTTEAAATPMCLGATAATKPDRRAHIGVAFLLALAGIGLFLARVNLRRRDRERTALTAFALPAVEEVVRATRLRSLATIAVAGAATSLALHDPALRVYAGAVAPLGAVLVIDAVLRYIQAGRVRALLRYDGATAEVHHDAVAVTVGKQRATLHAAPRLVDRARAAGLPRATL